MWYQVEARSGDAPCMSLTGSVQCQVEAGSRGVSKRGNASSLTSAELGMHGAKHRPKVTGCGGFHARNQPEAGLHCGKVMAGGSSLV